MSRTKGAVDKAPRKMPKTGRRAGITAPVDLPEGYNTKMINFIIDIAPTEPLDRSNTEQCVAEMERRFFKYLRICAERDIKIGNQAAYMAIGISKDDVYNWTNERSRNQAFCDFVKKVQYICSVYRESLMVDGKVNPVIGIFWQKNYDGLRDQQEVVLTPNNPLGDTTDTEALKRKYLENTYGMIEGGEPAQITESVEGTESK